MAYKYYDSKSDVYVAYRNHHDWLLPGRVFASVFVTGVLLEILGGVLLAVSPHHPHASRSFDASGAILLGLGGCLHAILLLLCCHAYCVVYTKDKVTQTSDEHTNVREQPTTETRVYTTQQHVPQQSKQDAKGLESPNLRKTFSSSQRQSPIRRYTPIEAYDGIHTPTDGPEYAHLREGGMVGQDGGGHGQDGGYSTQNGHQYANSGDGHAFHPIYAVVNKPPSAMKKAQTPERQGSERKRVRLVQDAGQTSESNVSPIVVQGRYITDNVTPSHTRSPYPSDVSVSPNAQSPHVSPDVRTDSGFISHDDENRNVSIRGENLRYYPEDKYVSMAREDMIDSRYNRTEYSRVRYTPPQSPSSHTHPKFPTYAAHGHTSQHVVSHTTVPQPLGAQQHIHQITTPQFPTHPIQHTDISQPIMPHQEPNRPHDGPPHALPPNNLHSPRREMPVHHHRPHPPISLHINTGTVITPGHATIPDDPITPDDVTSPDVSRPHDDVPPLSGVLLRPSQRRPMTFDQVTSSKMSVYDNVDRANAKERARAGYLV